MENQLNSFFATKPGLLIALFGAIAAATGLAATQMSEPNAITTALMWGGAAAILFGAGYHVYGDYTEDPTPENIKKVLQADAETRQRR